MPCPTCSHTLQHLDQYRCWCPRCGTLADTHITGEHFSSVEAPALVERCRAFRQFIVLQGRPPACLEDFSRAWHSHGIDEAINKPEDRHA